MELQWIGWIGAVTATPNKASQTDTSRFHSPFHSQGPRQVALP